MGLFDTNTQDSVVIEGITDIMFASRSAANSYIHEHDLMNVVVKQTTKHCYRIYARNNEASTKTIKEHFSSRSYILIARQLCYPPIVEEKLKQCTNDNQASMVMETARNGGYNK